MQWVGGSMNTDQKNDDVKQEIPEKMLWMLSQCWKSDAQTDAENDVPGSHIQ